MGVLVLQISSFGHVMHCEVTISSAGGTSCAFAVTEDELHRDRLIMLGVEG